MNPLAKLISPKPVRIDRVPAPEPLPKAEKPAKPTKKG